MQKVEGSSPFIRFPASPAERLSRPGGSILRPNPLDARPGQGSKGKHRVGLPDARRS
jgi:hypothetical protein